jgi:hypothetical protein
VLLTIAAVVGAPLRFVFLVARSKAGTQTRTRLDEPRVASLTDHRMHRSFIVRGTMRAVVTWFVAIVGAECASTSHPPQVRQVAVRDTALLSIVVRRTDSAGIRGVVQRPDGKPVPWAHVTLFRTHIEALGDSLGRFSMKLAPGSYTLWTNRIGYQARLDSIRVPRDGGLYLQIPLRERTVYLNASCRRLPTGGVIC